MAFSASDLSNIEAAMVQLAVDGIANCTVGGQSVTTKSIDELRRLREMVQADITEDVSHGGMKLRTMVPPGCG